MNTKCFSVQYLDHCKWYFVESYSNLDEAYDSAKKECLKPRTRIVFYGGYEEDHTYYCETRVIDTNTNDQVIRLSHNYFTSE